jgi:hypothetical protein
MSVWDNALASLDKPDNLLETVDPDIEDETDEDDESDEDDSWLEETKTVHVTINGTYQVNGSDYESQDEWDNILETEQTSYDNGNQTGDDITYYLQVSHVRFVSVENN